MRRLALCLVLASLLITNLFFFQKELVGQVTAQSVRQSIEKGVAYLKLRQKQNGSWDEWMGQPCGLRALCTLALLNSGVDARDDSIQRALKYLRGFKPEMTYSTALQTMVLARAEPDRDLLLLKRNVSWLQGIQITDSPRKGSWSYPHQEGSGDNSNAQFALLALYDAERAGVKVNEQTWRMAKNYWEGSQNLDGSWGYYPRMNGTGSMTCAGITSLVIANDSVQQSAARVMGDRIDCCGEVPAQVDHIEKAMQWLGRNFSVTSNPGAPAQIWNLYYLYGLERAGRMTARRFIGEHDWYREGADYLIRKQDQLSGYWVGSGHAENEPLIATSLSLLFLSKGRWPVLLSKLRHTPANDWNRHPSDVNNLTRFVESRWKKDLTWQITDLRLATVDDLQQSPVLFLCGSADFLPEEPAARKDIALKIRDYIDRGGFLFVEGYCGETGFDKSFRSFINDVFPEKEYRLRVLEPEHPIWHAETSIPPDLLRPLLGIEFGCRTSVIYAPLDMPRPALSCLWELSRSGREEKYSPTVKRQIEAALGIGANILAYATNRELTTKENFFLSARSEKSKGVNDRNRLAVAKIQHGGGCDTAPRALVNLLDAASRELKTPLTTRDKLLSLTDDALFDYHLIFMHGRNSFRFTDLERERLKNFIERGGMLFADSICANQAFSESFRTEMEQLFPKQKLERIPIDDPLLSTKYGGFDLRTVGRRDPQAAGPEGVLQAAVKKVPPELEGIRFDDRWGVIFSPLDLSCALEKQDTLDCRGYIRTDAARLGINIILYSVQQ